MDDFTALTHRALASNLDWVSVAYRVTHDLFPRQTGFAEMDAARTLGAEFVTSGRHVPTWEEAAALVKLVRAFMQSAAVGRLNRVYWEADGDGGPLIWSPELRTVLATVEQFRQVLGAPFEWEPRDADAPPAPWR